MEESCLGKEEEKFKTVKFKEFKESKEEQVLKVEWGESQEERERQRDMQTANKLAGDGDAAWR